MSALRALSASLLSPVSVLSVAVVAGYGLYERFVVGAGTGTLSWTVADHLMRVLASPQLIVMVLFPLWLGVILVGVVAGIDAPERLVRYGSRARTLGAMLVAEVRLVGAGAVVVLIAATATSAGLPASGWGEYLPVLGVMMPMLAFVVLGMLVVCVRILSTRTWPALTVAVALWLWAAAGAVGGFTPPVLLNLATYLSPTETPETGSFLWRVLVLLGVAFVLALVVRGRDRHASSAVPRAVWACACGVLVLLAAAWAILVTTPGATDGAATAAAAVFAGRGGTAISTGFTLLLLFGFAGVCAAWLDERRAGFGLFELIRLGSPQRWWWRILGRVASSAIAYTCVVLGGVVALYLLLGGRLGNARENAIVLLFLLILTSVSLVFVTVLVLGTVFVTGSRAGVLVAVVVLAVLNLFMLPGELLPFTFNLVNAPITVHLVIQRAIVLVFWTIVCVIGVATVLRFRGNRTLSTEESPA